MAGDETGAVLVLVAVSLPLLILLGSFVIDVGNWFVHKRHLQVQADAAALAAAGKFKFPVCDGTVEATIASTAEQYGGIAGPSGTPSDAFNVQVGTEGAPGPVDDDVEPGGAPGSGTGAARPARSVHMVLNQKSWYDSRPDPADVDEPLTGHPCADKMVDVKMTEADVPWLFRAAGVDYVDAQARVALKGLSRLSGLLPVGVEDVNPKRVHVWLFDEDTGADLGQAELARNPDTSGGLLRFDNAVGRGDGPIVLDVRSQRIGVRVAMSGSDSITCTDQLVLCYGFGAGAKGVTRVRGFLNGGTGVALREVILTPPTACGAPNNAYFGAGCTSQTVNARIDGINPLANTAVTATITGSNQNHTLTYDTASGRWVGAVPVATVAGGSGPHPITLKWAQRQGTVVLPPGTTATCSNGNGNPCQGTLTGVQSTFDAGRDVTGPIKSLEVVSAPLGSAVRRDDHNVERCPTGGSATCLHSFVITIGIGGRLELASPTDPPVSLRVFNGSQNQSLDCDPDVSNLDDEIANGCDPEYAINGGQACPNSPQVLWQPQPPAWQCVAIQTGTNANAPARGLNTRVYGDPSPGATCPPDGANHWPDYPEGDRRIMPVFVVPFGSFDGSGTDTVPVIDFAFFYVTGWTSNGNGFRNPCKDEGDDFVPGTEDDSGAISGHFMVYVTPNQGGGGEEACDFQQIGGCVAVLVK